MKKNIIGIAIAIVVLVGIVWFARPDSKENTAFLPSSSLGTLSAEEITFDFGTISMASGKVSHMFKIKNTGTDSVVIEKMYTSCMCTTATFMMGGRQFGPYGMPGHGSFPKINQQLGAGEEAAIEVVFDPAAHGPAGVGRIERSIIVENNAGQPFELEFAAVVTP